MIRVFAVVLLVACSGCAWTWDNTANSGERIDVVLGPCAGATNERPVGGNTGSENRSTRGGNADAAAP